jgi:predicted DNA-binding transcriptional regulator AlpA
VQTPSQQSRITTRQRVSSPRNLSRNAIADQSNGPVICNTSLHVQDADHSLRLIHIKRVGEILCLKKSAIHAKVVEGILPAPLKFGVNRRSAARWLECEILEFVQALAAQRPQVREIAHAASSNASLNGGAGTAV